MPAVGSNAPRTGLTWQPLAIGFGVTLILAVLVWTGMRGRAHPPGQRDDAYGSEVVIANPRMLRADSLMAGGVTFLQGTLENRGPRELTGFSVELTFYDSFGNVVQRENRTLLDGRLSPLAPRRVRSFQIGFDHIAAQWNQAPPQLSPSAVYVH